MTSNDFGSITVAVEGCCHGELDRIYATIAEQPNKVDLLIVCGDFQCVRNRNDLNCVSMPEKYRQLNSFHDYVTGVKIAPILTIFIGGNHEASNILHSLYYGGFVAPNIYFLGFAGSVWFDGIHITGVSGIYNSHHFYSGHYESAPYSYDMLKSIYHVRELEIYRLAHLSRSSAQTDIMISHDWPQNIWDYGDKNALLRVKPYFRDDIQSGKLGSPPLWYLLNQLKPNYWFAAHLHVKFPAIVAHTVDQEEEEGQGASCDYVKVCVSSQGVQPTRCTRFLALDKVIPGRDFLQILSVPRQRAGGGGGLEYDPEWLAILKSTHYMLSTSRAVGRTPSDLTDITPEAIDDIKKLLLNRTEASLEITPIGPAPIPLPTVHMETEGNAQTDLLLELLGLPHIWTSPLNININAVPMPVHVQCGDRNEIDIDDL